MTFYNPKIILPETGEKVNLKLHDLYHYESGYIFDGKNFRRCVFEIGDIIPMNKVIEWSREDNIWHNSNEEQPDGIRRTVCYCLNTNGGEVGIHTIINPNYRWAYLEDLDPEYVECGNCVNDKGCIICENGEQKQTLA